MSGKQRPLLMRPELVRATLAGIRTVTRRLDLRWLKVSPGDLIWVKETWRTTAGLDGYSPVAIAKAAKEAGYSPWGPIEYVADGYRDNWELNFHRTPEEMMPGRTRVSVHMPKWASRLWLEVVSAREELLHDITAEDAKSEGLTALTKDGHTTKYGIPDRDGLPGCDDDGWPWADWSQDPRDTYRRLWDQINGSEPGALWAENPRLVRIEFKRVERPAPFATRVGL